MSSKQTHQDSMNRAVEKSIANASQMVAPPTNETVAQSLQSERATYLYSDMTESLLRTQLTALERSYDAHEVELNVLGERLRREIADIKAKRDDCRKAISVLVSTIAALDPVD